MHGGLKKRGVCVKSPWAAHQGLANNRLRYEVLLWRTEGALEQQNEKWVGVVPDTRHLTAAGDSSFTYEVGNLRRKTTIPTEDD